MLYCLLVQKPNAPLRGVPVARGEWKVFFHSSLFFKVTICFNVKQPSARTLTGEHTGSKMTTLQLRDLVLIWCGWFCFLVSRFVDYSVARCHDDSLCMWVTNCYISVFSLIFWNKTFGWDLLYIFLKWKAHLLLIESSCHRKCRTDNSSITLRIISCLEHHSSNANVQAEYAIELGFSVLRV